jgi:hypothetical protein
MRAIFISYRRDDSEGEAGRLFDDLVRQFGEASVFMDVAGIELGTDFRKAIDRSVATCGVLLAIIGKSWLNSKNDRGELRLENPSDFVRLETAAALRRDIPVIPVLIHGAAMPRSEQLPADIRELAYRNGVELSHPRWSSDVQLLIKALRPYVDQPKPPDQPDRASAGQKTQWWKSRAFSGAVTAVLIAIAMLAYIQSERQGRPISRVPPNFAGAWELTSFTMDGVPRTIVQEKPLIITQNGHLVSIDSRALPVTGAGAVTYKTFYAHDGDHGHEVNTEEEADLADTFTWKLEGGTLVFETVFNFRNSYHGHPPGKEIRIMKYRRISPR